MTTVRRLVPALALVLSASPALAATDAATAAQLEQELKALTQILSQEQHLLKLEGEPKVVADDGAYIATLPPLRINLSAGDYARIPTLSVRLEPQDENTYRFSLTLPSPLMTISDITDVPTHVAAVQGQDVSGLWDRKNQLVQTMKADLRGLTLTEQAKNYIAVSLDRLSLETKNELVDGNKLNGQTLVTSSALRGYDEKENEVFNLAGLAANYRVEGADWSKMLKSRESFSGQLGGDIVNTAKLTDLAGKVSGFGGRSALAVVLNNLSARFVSQGLTTTDVASVQLDQMRMLFSNARDAANLFHGDMTYHHDGLIISGLPSIAMTRVIPTTADVKARLVNLPVEAVISGLESSGVPQSANAPSALNSTEGVLRALHQAKTALILEKLNLNAPLLTTSSNGRFEASPGARYGLTGGLTVRLGKLDELTTELANASRRPMTPDSQPDLMAPGMMMGMTMLKGFGNAVQGDSTGLREYVVNVAPDGNITLNGTNILSLFMGAGALNADMPGRTDPRESNGAGQGIPQSMP